MRLFLLLIAASSAASALPQNCKGMNPIPAHYTRWPPRAQPSDIALTPAEKRSIIPPVLPDYKAEIFECGIAHETDGYCCDTVTQNGVGMGCKTSTPMIANFMTETVTYDCPMIIKDVEQKNTVGACCAPNVTMVTPTMLLHKCQVAPLASAKIESKTPEVVGILWDATHH